MMLTKTLSFSSKPTVSQETHHTTITNSMSPLKCSISTARKVLFMFCILLSIRSVNGDFLNKSYKLLTRDSVGLFSLRGSRKGAAKVKTITPVPVYNAGQVRTDTFGLQFPGDETTYTIPQNSIHEPEATSRFKIALVNKPTWIYFENEGIQFILDLFNDKKIEDYRHLFRDGAFKEFQKIVNAETKQGMYRLLMRKEGRLGNIRGSSARGMRKVQIKKHCKCRKQQKSSETVMYTATPEHTAPVQSKRQNTVPGEQLTTQPITSVKKKPQYVPIDCKCKDVKVTMSIYKDNEKKLNLQDVTITNVGYPTVNKMPNLSVKGNGGCGRDFKHVRIRIGLEYGTGNCFGWADPDNRVRRDRYIYPFDEAHGDDCRMLLRALWTMKPDLFKKWKTMHKTYKHGKDKSLNDYKGAYKQIFFVDAKAGTEVIDKWIAGAFPVADPDPEVTIARRRSSVSTRASEIVRKIVDKDHVTLTVAQLKALKRLIAGNPTLGPLNREGRKDAIEAAEAARKRRRLPEKTKSQLLMERLVRAEEELSR